MLPFRRGPEVLARSCSEVGVEERVVGEALVLLVGTTGLAMMQMPTAPFFSTAAPMTTRPGLGWQLALCQV